MPSSPNSVASVRAGDQMTSSLAEALNGRVDPAAQARLDGFRVGREEGFERGRAQGLQQVEQRFSTALRAVSTVLADIEHRRVADEKRLESLAVELAVELAEAIVGGDLALVFSGQDVIARAFGRRRAGEEIRLRLHPDDARLLNETVHPDLEIVSDPSLLPGQALADIGVGVTDLSTAAAIERVREELS